MARLSLSPAYLKESIKVLFKRGLKESVLGKKVTLTDHDKQLLAGIHSNLKDFKSRGGRSGEFGRVDLVHKGSGSVYLMSHGQDEGKNQSILLFNEAVVITPGPDLWVYLSSEVDVKGNGLGDILDLGLVQGTKGGQAYIIDQPIAELAKYRAVVIWCKQFEVLFSVAPIR